MESFFQTYEKQTFLQFETGPNLPCLNLKKNLITNFNYTNLAMKMDVAIFPSWHSLKGKILLGFV